MIVRFLTIVALLTLPSLLSAQTLQSFSCYNNMYRQSSLVLPKTGPFGELKISDSYLQQGHQETTDFLRRGLQDQKGWVRNVGLNISMARLDCKQQGKWKLECKLKSPTPPVKATLNLVGWFDINGADSRINTETTAIVKNFELITRNSGSQSSPPDYKAIDVEAMAEIDLAGERIVLECRTFFYTQAASAFAGSACKEL